MVRRCYIQDYPENFRGNTETRTILTVNEEQSNQAREKNAGGWWLTRIIRTEAFYKLLT